MVGWWEKNGSGHAGPNSDSRASSVRNDGQGDDPYSTEADPQPRHIYRTLAGWSNRISRGSGGGGGDGGGAEGAAAEVVVELLYPPRSLGRAEVGVGEPTPVPPLEWSTGVGLKWWLTRSSPTPVKKTGRT